jgi:DNA-binding NtrC family response regulator
LPALYDSATKESLSEREILYKVLFEMRKDVNDLKKIVMEGVSASTLSVSKENTNLFENPALETTEHVHSKEPMVLTIPSNTSTEDNDLVEEVQDISHIAEDDSLSIEKKEKELIVRALRKNNNRRKYAARDLGISERTLYRKIKEYELEE